MRKVSYYKMKTNKRYGLNVTLLKNLNLRLDMTFEEISHLSGIPVDTFTKIRRAPSRISVQKLIAIANGVHVPISKFITIDGKDTEGEKEDYIISEGYKDSFYDRDLVEDFIDSNYFLSYPDAMSAIGSRQKDSKPSAIKAIMLAKNYLPANRVIAFCNYVKQSPFLFIVDPNRPKAPARHRAVSDMTALGHALHDMEAVLQDHSTSLAQIRDDITRLESKIDALISKMG